MYFKGWLIYMSWIILVKHSQPMKPKFGENIPHNGESTFLRNADKPRTFFILFSVVNDYKFKTSVQVV